ncbi:hypothetical protein [Elioraea sp.]|uniref:hypothetical protein n=1 Tax=Elioraea sp. TaxID=2185103 RepID=UPI003F6F2FC9
MELAEQVLAAQLSPEPVAPFAEPEAPRLELAEQVLAAQLPPEPIAPFAEPEAPRLEAAERALAAAVTPPTPTPVVPPVAVPAPAPPASAPQAPAAVSPPLPAATIELLLRRGEDLMRIGDVSAARRFFERAANGGSGLAALHAGGTYDPRVLHALGARGIPPDRAAALAWYRRAGAMGVAEAQARIAALEASP